MTFEGFSTSGLDYLTELAGHDKDWFSENRKTYEREVAQPAKDFVVDLGAVLRDEISQDIVALPKANGSISPINNDLRFAKDATPYKDHLLFRFWEGPNKKVAPTLFVRVSQHDVGFATGINFSSVDSWRERIDDESSGGALVTAIEELGRGRELDVAGQGLKRVPAPYAADHPREGLLRHKGFQARWSEPTPAVVHSAGFVDWCASRLNECIEIHRWLLELGS
jgi:uncharacterized protein (TIGR02453 family)